MNLTFTPPFWGSRLLENISAVTVIPFINRRALFHQQWGLRPNDSEGEEILNRLITERFFASLKFKAIYGYYPCQSENETLFIYDDKACQKIVCQFEFPRQKEGEKRSVADYFQSRDSDNVDLIPFQLVTLGDQASLIEKELYQSDQYQAYLFHHGLYVILTEALAEFIHQRIRIELGFVDKEPKDVESLLRQEYQGKRLSLGFSSCPNLADQAKILSLLEANRIGVSLSEGFQLTPEYSTSAFIITGIVVP